MPAPETPDRAYQPPPLRISRCFECPCCSPVTATAGRCLDRGETVRVQMMEPPPPQCRLQKWGNNLSAPALATGAGRA